MKSDALSRCIQEGNEGVYVDVAISPNSSRNEITGVNQWRDNLEISVKAEPSDGRANMALVGLLSESLGISKKNISITKGKRSEKKRVFFSGNGKEGLKRKILDMSEDRK